MICHEPTDYEQHHVFSHDKMTLASESEWLGQSEGKRGDCGWRGGCVWGAASGNEMQSGSVCA